jgi:LPXTG-motif cell wall-anchored protein
MLSLWVDDALGNDLLRLPAAGETIALGLVIATGVVILIALLLFAFKRKLKQR